MFKDNNGISFNLAVSRSVTNIKENKITKDCTTHNPA
jgi:hypothetical protein